MALGSGSALPVCFVVSAGCFRAVAMVLGSGSVVEALGCWVSGVSVGFYKGDGFTIVVSRPRFGC
jgi:hypothetical protein